MRRSTEYKFQFIIEGNNNPFEDCWIIGIVKKKNQDTDYSSRNCKASILLKPNWAEKVLNGLLVLHDSL